ncbi:MAG: radical SAM protein, partial [Alphaproteobacteria bacterium]
MAAPMIPGLNDTELENILAATAGCGAQTAGYVLLRMPHEIKDLFAEWLEVHYPLKARRVLSLVRETREGKLYDSSFATRMRGTGKYAELLAKRFALACKRLGLNRNDWALDTSRFRPPPREGEQLEML